MDLTSQPCQPGFQVGIVAIILLVRRGIDETLADSVDLEAFIVAAVQQVPPPPPAGVRGPVRGGWQESTLTRAKELESVSAWLQTDNPRPESAPLFASAAEHVTAAREAATGAQLNPKRLLRRPRGGGLIERALSNLDAAETSLLNAANNVYLLGMMPSILSNVQRHLVPSDARRTEFERIAQQLGIKDPNHPKAQAQPPMPVDAKMALVGEERGAIVAAMRAARSAALREQVRIRNFRNVVAWTTIAMALLAAAMAVTGLFAKARIPLCFTPEESGRAVVVCPTKQSAPFRADRFSESSGPATQPSASSPAPGATGAGPSAPAAAAPASTPATTPDPSSSAAGNEQPAGGGNLDIDDYVKDTVEPWDILIVELMGLLAAAVAAALAIRTFRGSSERHSVLVWLAALKLPTGAVTAFVGLMLMRGEFVPGLSALDTSAQILAWALVFGYGQQLFTRLVDQQGQAVLNSVRGADAAQPAATPP
ncbi:hypothetical protein ACIA5D_37025 [Actinoplanes sp. NPDC051513]|uniref:hypothetical protein n=1 Tax=Actinoplanes sp. NPDC051513 TaxID=3363908 RepID=UPI0037904438